MSIVREQRRQGATALRVEKIDPTILVKVTPRDPYRTAGAHRFIRKFCESGTKKHRTRRTVRVPVRIRSAQDINPRVIRPHAIDDQRRVARARKIRRAEPPLKGNRRNRARCLRRQRDDAAQAHTICCGVRWEGNHGQS